MAKLVLSKPLGDLPAKIGDRPLQDSMALKRVLSHLRVDGKPKLRGFYLSNKQILSLGTQLIGRNGADGICFMIGEDHEIDNSDHSVDGEGLPYLTIEMIPFKRIKNEKDSTIKFYNKGNFSEINLGKPFIESDDDFKIDGNGIVIPEHIHTHSKAAGGVATGPTTGGGPVIDPGGGVPTPNHLTGQHTPPPSE
jgi:hypothetical protein